MELNGKKIVFVVKYKDGRESKHDTAEEAFKKGGVEPRQWDSIRKPPEVWIRLGDVDYGPVLRP